MKQYIFKMSPEEFLKKVIELYFSAREPAYYHPKIKRGRSRTVAGMVEDLFASFLAFNLLEDYDFYVDQALTIEDKTIYPDIAIVKNGTIKSFVDVKMDLGWNRDRFVTFCEEKDNLILQIRNKTAKMKDGIAKTETSLKADHNAKYHIALVSNLNISKTKLEKNLSDAKHFRNICFIGQSASKHLSSKC